VGGSEKKRRSLNVRGKRKLGGGLEESPTVHYQPKIVGQKAAVTERKKKKSQSSQKWRGLFAGRGKEQLGV